MFNKSTLKIFMTLFLALSVNISFAQTDLKAMLSDLVGDYSTTQSGSYTFTVTDAGTTIKYLLKQFDYSNGKGMYICLLATPIYNFNKNFRASEEILQKISALNSELSPGTLNLLDNNLLYMSYFWDAELNSKVLGYEIVTGFINSAKLQKEIEAFMNK